MNYQLVEQPKKDKENTLVRAVVMPIAGPVACLQYDRNQRQWVDAELTQPTKKKAERLDANGLLWWHFRDQLQKVWKLAARASNWMVQELLRNEPAHGEKLIKPEKMNLYGRFTKTHPDRESWDGMAKSFSSLCRLVESKYHSERFEMLATHSRSAPSFRAPQPFPIHNQDWFPANRKEKKEGDGDYLVCFPLGVYRWVVRLRRDPTSVKFNGLWQQIAEGLLTRCEAQIYGQRVQGNDNRNGMTMRLPGGGENRNFRVLFKAVCRVEPKPAERVETLLVRTDPGAFWVAELSNRSPWILNADHVRRWVVEHKVFLQRFSEDTKYEKRWPQQKRNQLNEHRERRCTKQENRIKTFLEQSARSLAEYAKRNRVATVIYDDSDQSYVESFPWFKLKQKLSDNLKEYGIELIAKESANEKGEAA